MTIRVKCPGCAQTLKAEERHAGRTVKCPACREPVSIPAPSQPEEHVLDPFAELAEPATTSPPPAAPTVPRRRTTPEPAPPAEVPVAPAAEAPSVDEDEIGDWLTSGAPLPTEGDDFEVDDVPPESPNWDGVADTYELADTESVMAAESNTLPPKIRKKKKSVIITGPEDDRKRTARPKAPRPKGEVIGRPWLMWGLLACLLPLAISVVAGEASVEERIVQSVEANPDLEEKLENLPETSEDPLGTLLAAFPDQKIHGALLGRDSWMHLAFAAVSGLAFLGLILAMWPDEKVSPGYLVGMGVMTGTIGILLLLGFQYVAEFTQHFNLRGASVITLLFYIVKFIGFSYRCAIDHSIGFGMSFFGFTFGVGLCEELCKAAPVVLYLRGGQNPTWRGATVVGFASGIGFGVSEGITYSADMYNGLATPLTYGVRFLSCVALHTIWAGIVGLLMYRDQSHLFDAEWDDLLMFVAKYLGIAMVLHGLYDALLKFDHDFLALMVAAGSFAWLMWLVRREEAVA